MSSLVLSFHPYLTPEFPLCDPSVMIMAPTKFLHVPVKSGIQSALTISRGVWVVLPGWEEEGAPEHRCLRGATAGP